MKKFQFLLLDAGPIIKLFELSLWDKFIEKCDVIIPRTIVEDETVFFGTEDNKTFLEQGLASYEKRGLVKIVDIPLSQIDAFYKKFDITYQSILDPGEKEALTFLFNTSECYLLCSADRAVFRVLGLLGKSEQGISLEEILQKIGLSPSRLEGKFTKKFRENYTRLGQKDAFQDKGLKRDS
jgi:AraC-like DNA-binding protein